MSAGIVHHLGTDIAQAVMAAHARDGMTKENLSPALCVGKRIGKAARESVRPVEDQAQLSLLILVKIERKP